MSVLPTWCRLCEGLGKPVPTCCEDTATEGKAESSVCLVRIWRASSCWASSSCKRDKLAWMEVLGACQPGCQYQSCFSVPTGVSQHGETSQQRKLLPLRTTKTSLPVHPSSWFLHHDVYQGCTALKTNFGEAGRRVGPALLLRGSRQPRACLVAHGARMVPLQHQQHH